MQWSIETMPYCSKCGTKLNEGAKFCINCGNELGKPTEPVKNKQVGAGPAQPPTQVIKVYETPEKSSISPISVILGTLLLIGGIICFFIGFNGAQEYQTSIGQFERAISSEARKQFEVYQYMQIGGLLIAVLGLLGVITARKR